MDGKFKLTHYRTFTAKNVEDALRGARAELDKSEAELARVRGLLQRGVKLVSALVEHDYWNPEYLDAEEAAPEWIARSSEPEPAEVHAAPEIATEPNEIRVCRKHIVSFAGNEPCGICGGAESADIGKLNTADKLELLPTQLPKEK